MEKCKEERLRLILKEEQENLEKERKKALENLES